MAALQAMLASGFDPNRPDPGIGKTALHSAAMAGRPEAVRLLLGLGGTALGTAVSLAVIYVLNVRKIVFNFGMQQGLVLAPSVSVRDVVVSGVMVVLMALLASLQPAWKASRMDPVRALSHV